MKIKNKKGIELSVNTIIITILALVILGTLTYFLATRLGWFGVQTAKCPGTCRSPCDPTLGQTALPGIWKDPTNSAVECGTGQALQCCSI